MERKIIHIISVGLGSTAEMHKIVVNKTAPPVNDNVLKGDAVVNGKLVAQNGLAGIQRDTGRCGISNRGVE